MGFQTEVTKKKHRIRYCRVRMKIVAKHQFRKHCLTPELLNEKVLQAVLWYSESFHWRVSIKKQHNRSMVDCLYEESVNANNENLMLNAEGLKDQSRHQAKSKVPCNKTARRWYVGTNSVELGDLNRKCLYESCQDVK